MADAEPRHELPSFVDPTGVTRVLGTLASPAGLVRAMPGWAEAGNPILHEGEWVEFDIWPRYVKIKDQDGYGSCNGFAAALGLELARFVIGYEHVTLSPWYIYAPLCGGVDRGSSIADALRFLTAEGTCPDTLVPYGTIDPRRIPAEARAQAHRYKVLVGSVLRTWDEVMSAVQLRRPLNLSVHASGSFATGLDADGVPPLVHGPGNHAVTIALGAKKSKKWGWIVKLANSWGTGVGKAGFWWISRAHVEAQQGFEAYQVAAAAGDPLDSDRPPAPAE
jgi:hypothetical protein